MPAHTAQINEKCVVKSDGGYGHNKCPEFVLNRVRPHTKMM